MHPPDNFEQIVGGLRYSTDPEKSDLIASDAYWDGHNYERRGRNRFLYRTQNGRYFVVHLTQWQGEHDRVEPLEKDTAFRLYEELAATPADSSPLEIAFPDLDVPDA